MVDGSRDGWMAGWMDGQADGWMHGWMDVTTYSVISLLNRRVEMFQRLFVRSQNSY